jgi:hypothetical protein
MTVPPIAKTDRKSTMNSTDFLRSIATNDPDAPPASNSDIRSSISLPSVP